MRYQVRAGADRVSLGPWGLLLAIPVAVALAVAVTVLIAVTTLFVLVQESVRGLHRAAKARQRVSS